MKKLACIVFELEEGESEALVEKLEDLISSHVYLSRNLRVAAEKITWKDKFKATLNAVGITERIKGYTTLYYIIEAYTLHPEQKTHLYLKDLYDYTSEVTNTQYSRLERRVRTVIDNIYKNNPVEYANKILGIPNEYSGDITNSYFISSLINVIFD